MVLRFMYSVLCVLFIVICAILPRQIWFDFHKEVDALKVKTECFLLPVKPFLLQLIVLTNVINKIWKHETTATL